MNGTPIIPLDYETPRGHARKIRWRLCILVAVIASLIIACLTVPSLVSDFRAKERANRVQCAGNLRQIGQGIYLYTQANAGQYPDSLGTILLNEDIGTDAFVCLSTNDVPSAKPATREQAAEFAHVVGHHDKPQR